MRSYLACRPELAKCPFPVIRSPGRYFPRSWHSALWRLHLHRHPQARGLAFGLCRMCRQLPPRLCPISPKLKAFSLRPSSSLTCPKIDLVKPTTPTPDSRYSKHLRRLLDSNPVAASRDRTNASSGSVRCIQNPLPPPLRESNVPDTR
jgi:hypothetical protein